ncbi:uncharacterized protein NECHADRAFT_79818 [Fusarium vanettenii 77-13-4]|uniref:Uncharacterized protein n=1 Tax=Fusarium vanettenii (strain ATCC MYA-4622 / CBS 123669 / FGSC 9596 / NRRL 45880 / 77-13-4) TaxID=660122 RepID=C7ZM69_FUSV7|nr:uncharacterized protein NECHADRAFT_79818 [Fusarium vanettenii 77-13-4]EEU34941.1 hypothetical protein NECHADRAFT_79818 [Fusarium vanettenii 77-13-4]
MFAESDHSLLAQFPDKRPASPSFEGDTRCDKKSRLQAVEPDFDQDFLGLFESHHLPSFTPTSNDVSLDESYMELDEGNDTELVFSRAESPAPDTLPDTCFGVIAVSANSLFFRGRQESQATTAAVDMRPCGSFIKLYTLDSSKYAGIVTEPALLTLLSEPSVKVNASLVAPESRSSKSKAETQDSSGLEPTPTLRMVVYGTMRNSTNVGNLLSNAGLCFQQPSPRDVQQLDLDAEYFNPHYLVRPGSQMPRLEDLAIASDDATTTTCLDEAAKGQLMGIFDMAGDLGIKPTTTPSPRLRHQLTALAMLSEKECFSLDMGQCASLWEESEEMGLGKTLSVLSLICWSLDTFSDLENTRERPTSLTTLVVTTKSTITGWQNDIEKHIHPSQLSVAIYHGADRGRLAKHFRNHDIILTTYQTLRSDWAAKGPLFSEEWFRVVLDEAHHIGNRSTQIFRAACDLNCLRRWCLTGTPIQNTLDNYGALLSFLRIPLFVEKSKFDHWISNPVRDERPHGLTKLRILVQATCLRRTKRSISHSHKLPNRTEKIERVDLNPNDRELYKFFSAIATRIASGSSEDESNVRSTDKNGNKNVLPIINFLRRICNHGEDLLPASAAEAWKLKQSGLMDSQMAQFPGDSCALCHGDLHSASGSLLCAICLLARQGSEPTETPGSSRVESPQGETPTSPHHPSAKVEALIRNLGNEQVENQNGSEARPVKSVVFSYWTKMLDLVQIAFRQSGYSYERIDGQSSLRQRHRAMSKFNNNPACTVLLATIGSAGEGIDLTAANHVHLMEPHWNPMAEEQAIARVHRIGQRRPVIATKYITPRSIEEVGYLSTLNNRDFDPANGSINQYVLEMQKEKLALSRKALDFAANSQQEVGSERWKTLRRYLDVEDDV